jgi:hypothetical protein
MRGVACLMLTHAARIEQIGPKRSSVMNTKMKLFAAILVAGLGALTTGCYAEAGYVVTNDAYSYDNDPELVSAGPNVWIVSGQPSVYYADNYYWRYSGNTWYRSAYVNRGWVTVNSPPVVVVNHYGTGRARVYHSTQHVPARPSVRVRRSRVPQSNVTVRVPAPTVRVEGSTHVYSKPSKVVHKKARPSVRVKSDVRVKSSSRTRGR